MSYIITLQLFTILLCLGCQFRTQFKYVVLGISTLIAVISTSVFFTQLSNATSQYTSLFSLPFNCDLGIWADSLSITSVWIISTVSAIITCFSVGYFTKKLSIFLFHLHTLCLALMLFVCSNNLQQMYIFTEIITISSYFLIRFNSEEKSSCEHMKFMVPNRIGNALLLLSLIFIQYSFKSLSFDEINSTIISNDTLLRQNEWITFLLTVSLLLKTAQVLSSRWIKHTMLSPLPGAVLIHIAIAMNVFTIIRVQNLFEYNEFAQTALIILGLVTAVWCALKAMYANSLNTMLAYSTNSQIGLMVVACGFSAYGTVLILFVTYAFSKLLLFLAVGSVSYALSGETKIENMGGLFELLPKTYISFILATISMINLPLLSSYYAKKQFIAEIANESTFTYYGTILAILVSSIFICTCLFRMIYLIFHGKSNVNEIDLAYLNEKNHYINLALYISGFFAIFSGVFFYYFALTDIIWKDVFVFSSENFSSATWTFAVSNLIGIIGALYAYKSIRAHSFNIHYKFVAIKHINLEKLCEGVRYPLVYFHQKLPVISVRPDSRLLFLLFFVLLFIKVLI